MCGIAGFAGFEELDPTATREHMHRMLGAIRHRGPDQFGVYEDSFAALGSARLSIIDVAGGQQPIANEDGTLWIVFNGEIFNYLELRPDLEARGHRFATHSDTEVLLHLYEDYGPACLDRLNGQFAFAIWDARERRLFLARDRMGIRPLFYTETNGGLLFASEIKALLAHRAVTAELDSAALANVFTYWSTLPGESVFRGIHELRPGHTLTYSDGQAATCRYWELRYPEDSPATRDRFAREDDYLDEFEALLADATSIRLLRSDVPVGAYLSGGLDSSIIARLASARGAGRLATFSIAFDDPEFDESSFQVRMADMLGTRHEVVRATHADIAGVFPEVVWHTETPLTRTAPAPMFLLSKLARDAGFKVVLTGEGADEMLAGYDIFKEAAIRRFCARQPDSRLRPLLYRRLYSHIPGLANTATPLLAAFFQAGASDPDSACYSHCVRWRNNARARRFFSPDLAERVNTAEGRPEVPDAFSRWGALQRAQYLEASVFLSQYLLASQGDRVAMAHSVESRMPFLDYRVVEFCNRLPAPLKLRGLKDKYLLRKLGRRLLPDEVSERPKKPYRAPIHKSFFVEPIQDYVRDLLSPERIKATGLFRAGAVEQLVTRAACGQSLGETDEMALAGILSTQLVDHRFIRHYHAPAPLADRDDIRVCERRSAAARPF